MPTPPKAELKNYLWCTGCQAYIPKSLISEGASGDIFAPDGRRCPAGHTELQDFAEAGGASS